MVTQSMEVNQRGRSLHKPAREFMTLPARAQRSEAATPLPSTVMLVWSSARVMSEATRGAPPHNADHDRVAEVSLNRLRLASRVTSLGRVVARGAEFFDSGRSTLYWLTYQLNISTLGDTSTQDRCSGSGGGLARPLEPTTDAVPQSRLDGGDS